MVVCVEVVAEVVVVDGIEMIFARDAPAVAAADDMFGLFGFVGNFVCETDSVMDALFLDLILLCRCAVTIATCAPPLSILSL